MKSLTRLFWLIVPVSLVLALSWFCVFTFVNGYVIRELGRSDEDWTALTLWFSGASVIWLLLSSEISSRLGRRNATLLGMAATVAGYVGVALTRNMFLLGASLAVISLTTACCMVAFVALVIEAGGDRPGRALAIQAFSNNIVAVAALLGGGWLIEHLGFRTAFWLSAIAAALCTGLFAWASRPFAGRRSEGSVGLLRLSPGDRRALLSGPFLVLMGAGIALEPFNFHTINQLFPNLARTVFGLGEQGISQVVAMGRLPALLTVMVVGHYIDRLRPVRCYGIGLIVAASAVLTLGLAPAAWAAVGLYMLYYFGHGMVWASNSASINASVSPRLCEVAFALMMLVTTGAMFVVGLIHNRLLDAGLGLRGVYTACGCVTVGAGLSLVAYSYTRHSRREIQREPAVMAGATISE